MLRSLAVVLTLALVTSGGSLARAADWPQFRGPGGTGVSNEPNLPVEWSTSKNVAWKVPVPGRGWACPVVAGGKLFLATAVSEGKEEDAKKGLYFGGDRAEPSPHKHRWLVLCLDARSGKTLWEAVAHEGLPASARHIKNSHASETPAVDGERVYALFGNIGVYAYTLDGKPAWSRPLESFKTRAGWGTAASPVAHKGRVYIVKDNEEKSYVLALDARTGDEIWRADRDEKSNWATPFVWETPARTEIITCGARRVRSYGLDGKLLWELGGMSSITIPTPYAAHGLLYVSSGYVMDKTRPAFAIRPGAAGDISLRGEEKESPFIAWFHPQAGPYNPSTLVHGDHFYVLLDRGLLSCYDARSGKAHYEKKRFTTDPTAFTASPWAHGGKVFCLSEDGDTFVVEAGPEFKLAGKNSLDELCMATPAMADGALFIRTLSSLYRLQAPAK